MAPPSVIYLAQPPSSDPRHAAHDVRRLANLMPPLGLLSIAAYLRERGVDTRIFDFDAYPDSMEDFLCALARDQPSHLGITCVTATFFRGLRLARAAKKALSGLRVVFGGPHVSSLKEEVLGRSPEIDVCVVGEGEETFYRYLTDGPDTPGLALRDRDGKPRFTGHPESQLELDALPYPAYDLLRGYPASYRSPIFGYPRPPAASVISSRGCPYACSYCDRSVFRRSFRYNSAGYLYGHMHHLRQVYGVRHITFYDDQFTLNRERVVDLCERLIREPLGVTFNCAVRADHIDQELLSVMKRAGCWAMSLGIETGDPELLARHRSSSDVGMLADRIRHIKQAGIRVKGLLMIGLPGESEATVRRTMDYVFSLPIDEVNLAKFTPCHGAPLYATIREQGEFDEDWDKMDCMNFQFIPHGMTRELLDALFLEFYRRHFSRPRVWWNYLTMVWKSPDSWRRFLLHLGDFLRFAFKGKTTGSRT